jgi:hypothetical protein
VPKNPLFSTYRTGENRVTASMLAVFERIDPGILERLLAAASEESSLTFVRFANQVGDVPGSVPDAAISASFHYLFEVKTEFNALRRKQLGDHLRGLGDLHSDERLFVITPDGERPALIDELDDSRITWFNFSRLNQAIDEVLKDPGELLSEQSRFLLRELQALFEHEGLLGQVDAVIVAARMAYPEYKRCSAYICQPNRAFRPGISRMGFYANGAIQREIPEILVHRDNVSWTRAEAELLQASDDEASRSLGRLIGQLIDADGRRPEGERYQVFLLSPPDDPRTLSLPHEIRNTTRDTNGRPWAWTLGQRYTRSGLLETGPATTGELDAAGER